VRAAQKNPPPITGSGFGSYLSALAALRRKSEELRRAVQTLFIVGQDKSCGINVNNRKHSSEIFYRSHFAAPFMQVGLCRFIYNNS